MPEPHPVLLVRQTTNGATGEKIGRSAWLQCPGCNHLHRFILSNDDGTIPSGPVWEWDGDLEQPTFSPSLLCIGVTFYTAERDPDGHRVVAGSGNCHSFVRAGRWEFLSDSGHHLAGQTVDLVPLPDWFAQEVGS